MSTPKQLLVSKRKLFLALISITLICSLASGSIMYVVAQGGSTPITISSGIYPAGTSYTIYNESTTYYSKNSHGIVAYSSASAVSVITDTLASSDATTVQIADGTYACGGTKVYVSSKQTLIGAGKDSTILTFTGTGGVVLGTDLDGEVSTENAVLEGMTISGDDSVGSVGLRRVNNLYGTIRQIKITNFETGFIEEAWFKSINIVNKGYDIDIFNFKYGVVWDRRDVQGGFPVGNNLNIYYNLMCYSTAGAIVSGSIGYWHKDGQANLVYGGWTEKCDTGIQVDTGQACKFLGIYQEACNTYVELGAVAYYNVIDSITYWVAPEVLYTDAGLANDLQFSKTVNSYYISKAIILDTGLIWKTGTSLGRGGAGTDIWIGHNANDDLNFNVPAGKVFSFTVDNNGVFLIYADGEIQYLKVKNSVSNIGNIGAGTVHVHVALPLAEPDVNYGVSVEVDWSTTTFVQNKTTNGFDIGFGTATGGTGGYYSFILYR
jgi:hypothetical protein